MNPGRPFAGARERDPGAPLVQHTVPDPVLRSVCEPVDGFDRAPHEIVEDMRQLMPRHEGAGPSRRGSPSGSIAEINGRALSLVNPRRLRCGAGFETAVEGCLSLPAVEVPVSRAEAVGVKGRTRRGSPRLLRLQRLERARDPPAECSHRGRRRQAEMDCDRLREGYGGRLQGGVIAAASAKFLEDGA